MLTKQNLQENCQAPLITFIVTCYNLPAEMICQCLDSIIGLSFSRSEREIIVVDDGSDVSPLDQLNTFIEDIVYVRQPNAGLSAARNRGIDMASGQYLQFVDGDDYLLRTAYEHCLDIIRYQKPDIVMFDFTNEDEKSYTVDVNDNLKSGCEYLAQHNLQATAWGYLFKRDILGNLRFTRGIYHEDEEFTPQLLLRAESVCSTDAKAYYYRRRPHSITNEANIRFVIRRLNDCHLVICKLNNLADTMPPAERKALQRRVAQLTMDYIYNIIIQTGSQHYLERKLSILRNEGLFPLPDRPYTTKYKWFRRFISNSLGQKLLLNVLPIMNKER